MFNILKKIAFLWKRPKIIIIGGDNRETTAESVFYLLKQYFKVEKFSQGFPNILNIFQKDILIFDAGLINSQTLKDFKFLIKKSRLPILVITNSGDKLLEKISPSKGYLVLNFDKKESREVKEKNNLQEITFGFQEGADFRATDINLGDGTNFKINYKGNIVPIWLEKVSNEEEIYPVLGAIAVGIILGLNLVEISNALKNKS